MAHKILWFQGSSPLVLPRCDGRLPETCPQSRRIADEYKGGIHTLTNVLNPNIFYDDYGIETPLKKTLAEVKVGDYLWLALVPPRHWVTEVFAYNESTFTENSSLDTMGGISLELVTGKFKAANANGDCSVTDEKSNGMLVFPDTPDAKSQFVRNQLDEVLDNETWYGVGFKVTALPTKKTLADIVGKIVIGIRALDYEAQTFM